MKQIKNAKADISAKKSKGKKIMLIGFGLAGASILSYFGWQYFNKRKSEQKTENPDASDDTDYTPPLPKQKQQPKQQAKNNTASPSPLRNDNFPLKKGSKGDRVKALQNALIVKYGQGILPKYGADGDFGSETATALAKVGLPANMDETTFNVLIPKGEADNPPNPSEIGKLIYAYAVKKDFQKTLALLKTLKNVNDYTAASDTFKTYRIGGVRQTLVNGVLNSFANEKQKQEIKLAFASMGLKYDGNKWSLSGFGDNRILITTQPTKVWKNPRTAVRVPANMVLGKEISRKGTHVVFENERQYFIVAANHVKEHK